MEITADLIRAARREICSHSLAEFVKLAWPVIEPGQRYVHGRHIDVMCEHLEAVTSGEIRRLLINVPPGTSKSTLVGVFWPMWEWGPKDMPSSRYVGVAHEQTLGIRDNLKCRRLAASPWYQALWGDRVVMTRDQNEKLNFENAATGFRQVATPSNITGRRGDRVIIDDPLSAENANSETEREKVNLWFRESLPTRLNNPDRSAIVVVMQRLHERDVAGVILSERLGYEHLMLPMRFEPDRTCVTVLGQADWRKEEGELLFPERFPANVVDELEKTMGVYATAGQHQQRPSPREGGMFKRSWFRIVGAVPVGERRTVRAWDLAATRKTATNRPDWTAGIRVSRGQAGDFLIEGIDRMQGSPGDVETTIRARAALDGTAVTIRLPQDPGQAGKAQAETYVRMLAGYAVKVQTVTGDKATRAAPAAAQAEAGNISILMTGDADRDAWIEPFLAEVALFPAGANDDQCLVAGTMVMTATGEVPIEQIIPGDLVFTRAGLRRVSWAGMTASNAKVVTAHLSDGRHLTGTPNHPVFIDDVGFVSLDATADAGYLFTCQRDCHPKRSTSSNSTASPFAVTHSRSTSLTGDITLRAAATSFAALRRFIERFGSTITDQFRTAATSIIATMTRSIMIPAISSASPVAITRLSTPERGNGLRLASGRTWAQFGLSQRLGIAAKPAGSGMSSTGRRPTPAVSKSNSHAPSVGNSFCQRTRAPAGPTASGFVRSDAPPAPSGKRGVTRASVSARFVARPSKAPPGAEPAPVSVLRISAGETPAAVYNLKVEGEPEFFANGVLVHNCDALADAVNELALGENDISGWLGWAQGKLQPAAEGRNDG